MIVQMDTALSFGLNDREREREDKEFYLATPFTVLSNPGEGVTTVAHLCVASGRSLKRIILFCSSETRGEIHAV